MIKNTPSKKNNNKIKITNSTIKKKVNKISNNINSKKSLNSQDKKTINNKPKKIIKQKDVVNLDTKIRTTKKSSHNLNKLLHKMKQSEYQVASSTMWLLNGMNKKDLSKIIPKFEIHQLERICQLLIDNINKINKICQDQLLQKHFAHHEEYNKFALYLISKGRATFMAFLDNPKLYYTPLLSIHKEVKHLPRMAESILFMDEIDKYITLYIKVL